MLSRILSTTNKKADPTIGFVFLTLTFADLLYEVHANLNVTVKRF
ncbi:hypothetical protein [Vibrio vulnificus YJ016]|uniref:Uncharacterized protein n=1 Tax=Vibrio vulnificus (strain YJ016) TaxID=196600 RepID=Q7MP96_VIBVY|nr:hypothetical protein [Vibrio vulnificus YJ016]